MKAFNYQSEFNYEVVELKGEKKYYVQGYISTIDPDDSNEVVTIKAQQEMVQQCKGKIITIDVEHEEWYDNDGNVMAKPDNVKIPVGKIVDAELRSKGVWAKVELNKDSPRFKNIWGSIKNKFLHSFSIAFYPLKAVTKAIDGVTTRFIESLNLINVTFTGSPVNSNATFSPVMKAALKSLEDENMTEEKVNEAPVEEAKQEDVKVEEAKSEKPSPLDELKKELEETKKALDEQKSQLEEFKKATETPVAEEPKVEQPNLDGPLASIKSMKATIESNKKDLAELKAFLDKPIIKSKIDKEPLHQTLKPKPQVRQPMDYI